VASKILGIGSDYQSAIDFLGLALFRSIRFRQADVPFSLCDLKLDSV